MNSLTEIWVSDEAYEEISKRLNEAADLFKGRKNNEHGRHLLEGVMTSILSDAHMRGYTRVRLKAVVTGYEDEVRVNCMPYEC